MLEEEGHRVCPVPVLSVWHTIACALSSRRGEKSIPTEDRLPWRVHQVKEGDPMWGQPAQTSQSPSGPGWFGVLKPELGEEGG